MYLNEFTRPKPYGEGLWLSPALCNGMFSAHVWNGEWVADIPSTPDERDGAFDETE